MPEQGETDKLDRLVADLQREIDHKEQALYSAKVLQQAIAQYHQERRIGPE